MVRSSVGMTSAGSVLDAPWDSLSGSEESWVQVRPEWPMPAVSAPQQTELLRRAADAPRIKRPERFVSFS